MTVRFFNLHLKIRILQLIALCFMTTGCLAPLTDVSLSTGNQSKILASAEEIRKLTGSISVQSDASARLSFEDALSAWRASAQHVSYLAINQFAAPEKLFNAYIAYLTTSKKLLPAVEVLRSGIQEAVKAKSYRTAVRYRIDLADALARIGQIEAGQRSLVEAQTLVDRIFGQLSSSATDVDSFQLAANAEVLSAQIRLGVAVTPAALAEFSRIYTKAIESNPAIRFVGIETPTTFIVTYSHLMDDQNFYRRDQEYWRWFALGALRSGDHKLAQKFLRLMSESAEAATRNVYRETWKRKNPWENEPIPETDMYRGYMRTYYFLPQMLKHTKYRDTFFGLETRFDTALAGAEMYLMLDETALAEKMIAQASESLPAITEYSNELKAQGHSGVNVGQRAADIKRVTGKLLIKKRQWREALVQLDQFIQWSEEHRDNLPLEERLPYFRSMVQGSYLDALYAKASLYNAEPTKANYLSALGSVGRLKARHLIDSLDASNKLKGDAKNSTTTNLESIINKNGGFLSITDMGDKLIVFFADRDGEKIRITNKSSDFDKTVLLFRNNLAEQQSFDTSKARAITTQALGELEERVFRQKALFVEIDGTLSFLPVELFLNSKMVPLARQTAVAYIPSLAMLDLNRTSSVGKGVLAFGDARFNQNKQIGALGGSSEYALRGKRDSLGFMTLPETREEVLSIVKSVREGGKAMLGEDATKTNFFREARVPYRYLHFATHGVVGGEIPRLKEPALVLTPESNDPGFLTATEIGKLNIAADLVVLSACNSGNGEYYNGEGLMGLGRAFILAGTKAVVVSLWPVDSLTTKDLMMQFYKELEVTGNATAALAKARITVMESRTQNQANGEQRGLVVKPVHDVKNDFSGYRNPFFWAPFVLIESGL